MEIPIGLHRMGDYVFLRFRYGKDAGKTPKNWFNTTRLQQSFEPDLPTQFATDKPLRSQYTVYWQPDMPIFDKPGVWYVSVMWVGPEENIYSPEIPINISAPTGNGKVLVDLLKKEDALGAFNTEFWRLPEFNHHIDRWQKLYYSNIKIHQNSPYGKLLDTNIQAYIAHQKQLKQQALAKKQLIEKLKRNSLGITDTGKTHPQKTGQ